LASVGAIYLFARHHTAYDWFVGAGLLTGSALFVSGCLWRHYTIVDQSGVLHSDWWGVRIRYFTLDEIIRVDGRSVNASIGILPPVLVLRVVSARDSFKLSTSVYPERKLGAALRIMDGPAVSISPDVRSKFGLEPGLGIDQSRP
jgi:hypothetical protein